MMADGLPVAPLLSRSGDVVHGAVLDDDAVAGELVLASVPETGHPVAGFAGICPSRDPVEAGLGELDTIAVDPRDRRAGAGRAPMAVARDTLRGTGYTEAIMRAPADCQPGHGSPLKAVRGRNPQTGIIHLNTCSSPTDT